MYTPRSKQVVSIFIFLFCSMLSYSFGAEDANSIYQQAMSLEQSGKLADALALYNKVITEFPNSSVAGPDQAAFHVKLVTLRTALDSGDIAGGKRIASEIRTSALEQGKGEQIYWAGYWLGQKNLFADAISYYKDVLDKYPDCREAKPEFAGFHIKLATLRMSLDKGDTAAALQSANQIRTLACLPQSKPKQLYWTGYWLAQKGLFSDAKSFYKQVIDEYPSSAEAGADLAGYYMKTADMRIALAKHDTIAAKGFAEQIAALPCSTKQKPWQLYWTGYWLAQNEMFADGQSLFKEVIEKYPDSIEAGPDNAGFQIKMAAMRMSLGKYDPEAAKGYAEQIMALNCSPKQKPWQLYWTGLRLEQYGLYPEAQRFYNRATTDYPNAVEAGPDYIGFHAKVVALRRALIEGDIATANNFANQITNLGSSPKEKLNQLFSMGHWLEQMDWYTIGAKPGQMTENINAVLAISKSFYKEVIDRYPTSDESAKAKDHNDILNLFVSINNGDLTTAQLGLEKIKSKYAADPNNYFKIVFNIAEKYFVVGEVRDQNECFRISTQLVENDLMQRAPDIHNKASMYFVIGRNGLKFNEYLKSAHALAEAYRLDPSHCYADYCLYQQGRCYEKLIKQKAVSEAEAKETIRSLYSELISKFPKSSYLHHAQKWMDNNSK